jgi:nifR3 family TIM-barrel protein
MISGFWKKLKKPILVLAPMANVTDAAFRRIIAEYGKPDVMWTEFVSAEGLMSAGRETLMRDLAYTEAERPIVAQFFTGKPEIMERAASLALELGFDGVDINMGCPDGNIEKSGAGAFLIKDPKRAEEVIEAAKRGAGPLPVSVKTRLGYNKMEYEEWIPTILGTKPAALTVHLRTRKEMSEVDAHWEVAPRLVEIRNSTSPETLLLGNGDVYSLPEAERRTKESGMDGVMIGRGIFGNPWFFDRSMPNITTQEKLQVALEHARLFEELFGPASTFGGPRLREGWLKKFEVMKKHFKAYVNGFDGAKELRMKLMEAEHAEDVARILAQNQIPVYNRLP